MGGKFGSIQIRGGDLAAVAALAPGHRVCEVLPGWVSVLDEGFAWGTTQPAARRLSAALPEHTVLCTEYFDGDFVEFSLYRAGRKMARHIPASYEGFDRHVGRMKDFVALLGLDPEEEKLLRLIFRETRPEVSLHLLESLLSCPIWMDPEEPRAPKEAEDRAYLNAYVARKQQKVRNRTKAVLTDEAEYAPFIYHLTYPFRLRREEGEAARWGVDGQGKICPIEQALPQELWSTRSSILDGYQGNGSWPPPSRAEGEVRYELRGWHELVSLDRGGKVLARLRFPETELPHLLCPLPGAGVVLLLGESTLEVYDRELTLLSRHRVKGWVAGALPREDGAASVLTYRQSKKEWGEDMRHLRVVEPDRVWVYRLGR